MIGLVLGGLHVLITIGPSIIVGLLGNSHVLPKARASYSTFFTLDAFAALTLYEPTGWTAAILAPLLVGNKPSARTSCCRLVCSAL